MLTKLLGSCPVECHGAMDTFVHYAAAVSSFNVPTVVAYFEAHVTEVLDIVTNFNKPGELLKVMTFVVGMIKALATPG